MTTLRTNARHDTRTSSIQSTSNGLRIIEDGRRFIEDERRTIQDERKINEDEGRTIEDGRRISDVKWKELERIPQNKQRQFLLQYEFKDEPVSSIEKNVSKGDHLYCQGTKGKLYEHHMLVTSVDGDNIEVIEYSGPYFGGRALSESSSSSNPSALAQVGGGKFSFTKLQSKKAYKRIWPDELRRFSTDEVIERAKRRVKERKYRLLDNNCEHFVIWCMCGLQTSLQVKKWYRHTWEVIKASVASAIHGAVGLVISKVSANVSDDIANTFSALPSLGVGFALVFVLEGGIAGYSIYRDWDNPDRDEFKVNTLNTVAKAAGRVIGNVVGSLIGLSYGPIAVLFGGALPALVGHFLGWVAGKIGRFVVSFRCLMRKRKTKALWNISSGG